MVSRLQRKLQDNKERRERERLLNLLPLYWSEKIEPAELISSCDFLCQFPVSACDDFARNSFLTAKSMQHKDFDDIAQVQAYLLNNMMILQPPILCWFGLGPAFKLNEAVELKWIAEISNLPNFHVYLTEESYRRGIICSEYLGYLSEERSTNDNEIVYDVVFFSEYNLTDNC
ncbi:hypothetical protein [Psychromonas ossibalaenae]|uniref:hypothetical protein n=1 Tax=Psychromonas ossibalaenae TaxID=444922 RepID=UPI00036F79E4|nr:hypothetical protein [Psychromonas ossibalaenae]